MRFFHYDAGKLEKKRRYILFISLLPLLQGSVIISLITIINLKAFYEKNYHLTVIYSVTAAAVMGVVIFFLVFYIIERAIRRNARHTFLEIGDKALVFSKYSGRTIEEGGRAVIMRKLYVLALKDLKAVGFNKKSGKIYLEAENMSVKEYYDSTERLSYRLNSGLPDFDSWWYNDNGFKSLSELKLPAVFGNITNVEKICDQIVNAKQNFDNLPEPRSYVHKEPEFIKRRKIFEALKNSNNR